MGMHAKEIQDDSCNHKPAIKRFIRNTLRRRKYSSLENDSESKIHGHSDDNIVRSATNNAPLSNCVQFRTVVDIVTPDERTEDDPTDKKETPLLGNLEEHNSQTFRDRYKSCDGDRNNNETTVIYSDDIIVEDHNTSTKAKRKRKGKKLKKKIQKNSWKALKTTWKWFKAGLVVLSDQTVGAFGFVNTVSSSMSTYASTKNRSGNYYR